MKKLYVIKNNDNEYLQYFDSESDDVQFTKDISLSMIYDENEKEIIKKAYSNMNWIYVEIIFEETNKLEHNQNQKAIGCLKEVKEELSYRVIPYDKLYESEEYTRYDVGCLDSYHFAIRLIDNKIKELEEKK